MKSFSQISLCVFILTSFFSFAAYSDQTKINLNVAELPPYISDKLPEKGSAISYFRKFSNQINLDLNINVLPYPRLRKLIMSNQSFVMYFTTTSNSLKMLPPHFIKSKLVGTFQYCVISKKEAKFQSVEDLKQGKVVGIKDQAGIELLKSKNINHYLVPNYQTALKMIQKNRGDFLLFLPDTFKMLLKLNPNYNDLKCTLINKSINVYLIFSKALKNKISIDQLNKFIEENSYEKYHRDYFLKISKPK